MSIRAFACITISSIPSVAAAVVSASIAISVASIGVPGVGVAPCSAAAAASIAPAAGGLPMASFTPALNDLVLVVRCVNVYNHLALDLAAVVDVSRDLTIYLSVLVAMATSSMGFKFTTASVIIAPLCSVVAILCVERVVERIPVRTRRSAGMAVASLRVVAVVVPVLVAIATTTVVALIPVLHYYILIVFIIDLNHNLAVHLPIVVPRPGNLSIIISSLAVVSASAIGLKFITRPIVISL